MAAFHASATAQLERLPGVWRGRELTRKERRLSAGFEPADSLLEGGIPRGRISELSGPRSSGKTTLAAAFLASATRHGEASAVIDLAGAFDPAAMAAAGVILARVLWVHPPHNARDQGHEYGPARSEYDPGFSPAQRRLRPSALKPFLRAAELVLEAGDFGLLILDFGATTAPLSSGAALRLARLAERSATAVLTVSTRPLCGTFAALSVVLARKLALFDSSPLIAPASPSSFPKQRIPLTAFTASGTRPQIDAHRATGPRLFDGLAVEASLRRNKLGQSGRSVRWQALVDPHPTLPQAVWLPAPQAIRISSAG